MCANEMQINNFGSWQISENLPAAGAALLPELAVIEASGADAEAFLHGQFTNHVRGLGNAFRLAAYCQPQGRILALMRVFKKGEAFFMVMPRELLPGFLERLSMYILRSKVTLREVTEWQVAGLINPEMTLPETDTHDDASPLLARVADAQGTSRAMVIGTPDEIAPYLENKVSSAAWFATDILAGLPWVGEATKEAFIPQWINLDLIGGLVFDKGCYPGQEVISRVQHIGKTPRRMVKAVLDSPVAIVAGAEVFESEEPVGNVVMSATLADKTYLLIEATNKAIEVGQMQVGGQTLQLL